jgi:hypothetical protein
MLSTLGDYRPRDPEMRKVRSPLVTHQFRRSRPGCKPVCIALAVVGALVIIGFAERAR